ncbi:MAG TPA: DUF4982 domain-containing protein [Tepidisphaeraceae bacterium]|jgi:hypothetical protein
MTTRLSLLAALALSTIVSAAATAQSRKYDFDSAWRVFVGDAKGADAPAFDDSTWKPVTLPHAWNEDEAFARDIHELSNGVAWYRKHFKLPADASGKKAFLEFEGIRQAGEFWLNGKPIGLHENGVMACGLDVTDAVRPPPEENVLAVRTDSSWTYRERATNTAYQWADRNFNANYGGINKRVWLHVTDKLHQTLPLFSNLGTTGVYVYAQDIDIPAKTATIVAEAQVRNEYGQPKTFNYEVTIQDMDGRTVKTINGGSHTLAAGATDVIKASSRVDGLNFWSWGYGYLYDVSTTLKVDGAPVDVLTTRTGFRKTGFGSGALKLNDRTVQVHGYAQRTTNEWPALGINIPPWLSDFSNRLVVEGNGNLVRWMHITPSKQDVESCDRVGLMQSMPAGDSERDSSGRSWEMRVEVMRDAIIYNRNNPSILFYECGNKGISEAHMAQMKKVRDQYDPHGGRAIGAREMMGSKTAEYGGEMLYINKSAGIPMWAMEYSRDEGLRDYWDEFTPPYHKVPVTNQYIRPGAGQHQWDVPPAYEYNRNQDSHAIEDVVRWYDYWRERPGTGTRVSDGGVNIIFSDSNTHFRGMDNFRRSGEVDAMRIPKDGYFADQVMWDGWVDVERPRAHIIGHWNYESSVKKDVYVVSSADKVELSLNGKSLGWGEQSSRFLFTFRGVQFEPGELKAVGCDAAGKKLCEDVKKTAGTPAGIRLACWRGPRGLRADGSDLALVDVEVVDANGNLCPTATNMISFNLSGPAEWRGGIGHDDNRRDNFILAKTLPVACGVNRVLIRSALQPGKITLTASSDGLRPATIELESNAVSVADGLSLDRPDANLPSNLERGPTPDGDSIHPTRVPLRIVAARASDHADRAALSFDDNETTSWAGDGWIEYDLQSPAALSEVTLKMGGFRTRSYPLRITVDGREAFTGSTPRSLGYVTPTFPPVTGKTVRIEAAGESSDRDAFGNIVEVGPNDVAPSTRPTSRQAARNRLDIIEAELYSPLP